MQHSAWGGLSDAAFFAIRNRRRTVEHPDVVVRIDGDAADLAGHPFVRQRLRPQRIRLEQRHLRPSDLRGGIRSSRVPATPMVTTTVRTYRPLHFVVLMSHLFLPTSVPRRVLQRDGGCSPCPRSAR